MHTIYDHLYIDYSEKDGSAVDPHYAILRLMLPLIPIHQETFITARLSNNVSDIREQL